MLIFIIGTAVIVLSSYFVASFLSEKERGIDFVISWFMLFFAQIVLVDLILGIAAKLYFHNIFILHLVICLSSFLFLRKRIQFQVLHLNPRFILTNKLLFFAISVFFGFFLVKFWNKLINPPVFPDVLQYHLSFPATWIRNGNIINPLVAYGRNDHPVNIIAMTYYPMSAEFYFHWLMAPLRNAFLADVGQAPFYILGILAIYSILRKFSLKKETALFLGVLWALIPNLFKQMGKGALADVMTSAVFLIILNYILAFREKKSLKRFVLFGIALAIFISIKAIDIFWALALTPLLVYVILRKNIKKGFVGLAIILFFALILGGYSYINNYILTKNLFYPITFKFLGKTIMPGIVDKDTFSYLLYYWEEFKITDVLFSEGLGLQLFAFIIPGTIIPFIFTPFFRKRFNTDNFLIHLLIFIVPLIMVIEYFFYIKAFWIRYFFPYLGAGMICFGIFLNKFKWGQKYITLVGGLCVLTSMAELGKRQELVASIILSLLLLVILNRIRGYAKKPAFFLGLSFFLVISLIVLNAKYNKEQADRFPLLFKGKEVGDKDIGLAWQWLHKNALGGKRIAYTGRGEFYPLFGPNLLNDVFYVSINNKPPIAHYYPDEEFRKEQDEKAWLNNLKNNKVDLLVVYFPHQDDKFPIEDEWAKKNSDKFKLVFANSKARIYSIN
jgi:hypothetical protein